MLDSTATRYLNLSCDKLGDVEEFEEKKLLWSWKGKDPSSLFLFLCMCLPVSPLRDNQYE